MSHKGRGEHLHGAESTTDRLAIPDGVIQPQSVTRTVRATLGTPELMAKR